jgi:hypothetical protein
LPRRSAPTYAALLAAAQAALDGGLTIIVDAAFLDRRRRQPFQALARQLQVPFVILHCTGTERTLRQRIAWRRRSRSDPSDADASVLEHQLATAEPLSIEEQAAALVIDSASDPDIGAIAARIAMNDG